MVAAGLSETPSRHADANFEVPYPLPFIVTSVTLAFGLGVILIGPDPGTIPYSTTATRFLYGLAALLTVGIGTGALLLDGTDRFRTGALALTGMFGATHSAIYEASWIWAIALAAVAGIATLLASMQSASRIPQAARERSASIWIAVVEGAAGSFPAMLFAMSMLRGSTSSALAGGGLAMIVLAAVSFKGEGEATFRIVHTLVGGLLIAEVAWIQSYTSTDPVATAGAISLATGAIAAVYRARISATASRRARYEPVVATTAIALMLLIVA